METCGFCNKPIGDSEASIYLDLGEEFGQCVHWRCMQDQAPEKIARLEAALTEIRDMLPLVQDEYSRRVFKIACSALEPGSDDDQKRERDIADRVNGEHERPKWVRMTRD